MAADYIEEDDGSTALVPYAPTAAAMGLVRPLVDHRAAAAAIREYEALKAAIVQDSDVQVIQGRKFLKKSFWRRVATCFGLTLELVSEARGFDEGGKLYYSVVYRAVAPNGRSMIGDGYCSTAEAGRGGWPEHSVRATAHTRSKNRAISDLVGGGEVSAEELPEEDEAPRQQQRQVAAPRPQARPAPAPRPAAKAVPVAALTMAGLRKRMLELGVRTMADADAWVREATGKRTWEELGEDDAPALAAFVAKKEAAQATAAQRIADAQPQPPADALTADTPSDYDLHELDAGTRPN